jgi:hypothetical protein
MRYREGQHRLDKGWLAYSEPELQWLRPEYTITRKTYSFAGRTIATRISGNEEGDTTACSTCTATI